MPTRSDAAWHAAAAQAPRLPWSRFLEAMNWQPGEHVLIIARTGSGKTVLLRHLLLTRPWAALFVSKPEDDSARRLEENYGFRVATSWDKTYPRLPGQRRHNRWLIWPDATQFDSKAAQAAAFHDAFRGIWDDGAWTVAADDAQYLVEHLRLGEELTQMFLQSRSLNISVVAASQRPRRLGVEALTQTTHLFFAGARDEYDLGRAEEVVGADNAEMIRELVPNLEPHQFLYVNTVTGAAYRTRIPADLAV